MSSTIARSSAGVPVAMASLLAIATACQIPSPEDADIGCVADAKASPLCPNYPTSAAGSGGAQATGTTATDDASAEAGDAAAPTDDGAPESGDAASTTPPSPSAPKAYATFGAWKGYCQTGSFPAGVAIPVGPVCGEAHAPPCTVAPGPAYCATGTVPGDTTYLSGAFLACNIAEDEDGNPANAQRGTVVTSGNGLEVHLSGSTEGLRVTLQADAAGNEIWCADVPRGGSGTIPWSAFDSQCWFGNGTHYVVGTPIASIVITVPSSPAATSFAFCLNSLAQY